MIKIPSSDKKYSQTNRSDISGNVWYTKNIDFSEEGYMKQSNRIVQVLSDSSLDGNFDTDFNYSPSIGRAGSAFFMATIEEPFKATLTATGFSATEDADASNPTLSTNSRGRWFQNAWHVSTDTTVVSKAVSGGAWTSRITSLTTVVAHPIEVFRNRGTICVGNGNIVKQYTSAYGASTDLTIPTDYEVVDISYSNNKVGVITKLSATASGQNQDAYFFVWDGTTTSSNGGYPLGVNEIVAITPYKGTWMLLSKTGQILYFNGGGFQELAVFPFFTKDRIWDDISAKGDVMIADGDLIYIQINGVLSITGSKQETVMINNPGGIWCYDPNVGLYHKWSPSISQLNSITVNSGDINTTTDILTATTGTVPVTGSPIKLVHSTTTPIGGLKGGNTYYVIKLSSNTFKLATSVSNALASTSIDITGTGVSTNYFLALTVKDYGQSFLGTTAGMVLTDTKNVVYDGLIMSYRAYNTVGSSINYFAMTVSGFDNISYYVTPRIESQNVEDIAPKLYIKYRPLKSSDTITIKYRNEDILGIPATTPMRGQSCTWTSTTTLTLAGDLSEIDTYLDLTDKECELEVISGSGAGQMSKISSISESTGTYTITLTDTMEGVTASDTCNIIINNWKTLKVVSSGNTKGYEEIAVNSNSSKFIQFKVIMKGTDIVIEELQFLNETFLKSI